MSYNRNYCELTCLTDREMALATLLRLSPLHSYQPPSLLIGQSRNYIKNFFNPDTKIKPVRGWMHQIKEKQAGNRHKKMIIHLRRYSEIQRQRTASYEARMQTVGGRKIIMRRILRMKDHLSG